MAEGSEWQERNNKHRDFRQTKGEPEIPKHKHKKKPLKKWCKGKKGTPHNYQFFTEVTYGGLRYKFTDERCTGCGRKRLVWGKLP